MDSEGNTSHGQGCRCVYEGAGNGVDMYEGMQSWMDGIDNGFRHGQVEDGAGHFSGVVEGMQP